MTCWPQRSFPRLCWPTCGARPRQRWASQSPARCAAAGGRCCAWLRLPLHRLAWLPLHGVAREGACSGGRHAAPRLGTISTFPLLSWTCWVAHRSTARRWSQCQPTLARRSRARRTRRRSRQASKPCSCCRCASEGMGWSGAACGPCIGEPGKHVFLSSQLHEGRVCHGACIRYLLQEPVAAALAYGINGGTDGDTVLVFDVGGGTFDVRCARKRCPVWPSV